MATKSLLPLVPGAIAFLGLVIYCIITNPQLLLPLGFCVAAWWFISVKEKEYHVHNHVKLFGREFKTTDLWVLIGLASLPLFYFAGAGMGFWIIGTVVLVINLIGIVLDLMMILISSKSHFQGGQKT